MIISCNSPRHLSIGLRSTAVAQQPVLKAFPMPSAADEEVEEWGKDKLNERQ